MARVDSVQVRWTNRKGKRVTQDVEISRDGSRQGNIQNENRSNRSHSSSQQISSKHSPQPSIQSQSSQNSSFQRVRSTERPMEVASPRGGQDLSQTVGSRAGRGGQDLSRTVGSKASQRGQDLSGTVGSKASQRDGPVTIPRTVSRGYSVPAESQQRSTSPSGSVRQTSLNRGNAYAFTKFNSSNIGLNQNAIVSGQNSRDKNNQRLNEREGHLKIREARTLFFRNMSSSAVQNWLLRIPVQDIPDHARYNKIVKLMGDICLECAIDGLMFDDMLKDGRLDDFRIRGAHSRSFIGRRIEKRWILDFYTRARH